MPLLAELLRLVIVTLSSDNDAEKLVYAGFGVLLDGTDSERSMSVVAACGTAFIVVCRSAAASCRNITHVSWR